MGQAAIDESSVQDSSARNDFNEYRDILNSHTETYSDDEFASSQIESLNVSHAIVEQIADEDRVTPLMTATQRSKAEESDLDSKKALKVTIIEQKTSNP